MNTHLIIASVGALAGIVPVLLFIAIWFILIIGVWKVFAKGGQPGWACLIPIYNLVLSDQNRGQGMVVATPAPGSAGQHCRGHHAGHRHLTEFWQGRRICGGTNLLAVDFLPNPGIRFSPAPKNVGPCDGITAIRTACLVFPASSTTPRVFTKSALKLTRGTKMFYIPPE